MTHQYPKAFEDRYALLEASGSVDVIGGKWEQAVQKDTAYKMWQAGRASKRTPRGQHKKWWKRVLGPSGKLLRPLNTQEVEDITKRAYNQARRELLG